MAKITDEFFDTQGVKIQPRNKNWNGKRSIVTDNSDNLCLAHFTFYHRFNAH